MKTLHWTLALVSSILGCSGTAVLAQQPRTLPLTPGMPSSQAFNRPQEERVSSVLQILGAVGWAPTLPFTADPPGGKAVAHVKDTILSEEEYLERVQRVRQIPPNSGLDAGGLTLVSMIQDSLTEQLAVEKKLAPSEQLVRQFTNIFRLSSLQIQQQLVTNQMTDAELNRQARHLLELTALGTEGVKADPEKVQALYEELKKNPIYPASYTLRVFFVPDPMKGREIMAQLKASKDFQAAARALKLSPAEIANAGRKVLMTKKGAPEELVKALERMGNGPFTPETGPFTEGPIPIIQQNPNTPQVPGRTMYIIAQLIGKQMDETPPLDQIRIYVELRVLQQAMKDWQTQAQQKIREYARKIADLNQIQIHIERYKPLLESVILAQPPPGPAPR